MSSNPILNYFDLNRRIKTDYSLTGPNEPDTPSTGLSGKPLPAIPPWQQIVFYLGTVLGILLSSSILAWQAGKTPTIAITITTLILSAVIALLIMPHTYENIIKPEAPFIAQLGLFVQQGVFWSVLLTTLSKALG